MTRLLSYFRRWHFYWPPHKAPWCETWRKVVKLHIEQTSGRKL